MVTFGALLVGAFGSEACGDDDLRAAPAGYQGAAPGMGGGLDQPDRPSTTTGVTGVTGVSTVGPDDTGDDVGDFGDTFTGTTFGTGFADTFDTVISPDTASQDTEIGVGCISTCDCPQELVCDLGGPLGIGDPICLAPTVGQVVHCCTDVVCPFGQACQQPDGSSGVCG